MTQTEAGTGVRGTLAASSSQAGRKIPRDGAEKRSFSADGSRIVSLRLREGYETQAALAQSSGVSNKTVWNAECGKRVRIVSLKKLADALGCDWKEIVNPSDAALNSDVYRSAEGPVLKGLGIEQMGECLRAMKEDIQRSVDPVRRELMHMQEQQGLEILKSTLLWHEATLQQHELSAGGEVRCLETTLEQLDVAYWESYGPLRDLIDKATRTLRIGGIDPSKYKTLVTLRSLADLHDRKQQRPLIRLAKLLTSVGAPVGFVEGSVLRREGVYLDFTDMGESGYVRYCVPGWIGSRVGNCSRRSLELRDLWMSAAERTETLWITSLEEVEDIEQQSV